MTKWTTNRKFSVGTAEGDVSKDVPIDKLSVVITLVLAFIFLHEKYTVKSVTGCILIGAEHC